MPVPIPAFVPVLRLEGAEVGEEVVVCIKLVGLAFVVCVESAGSVFVVCVESAGLVFVGGVKVGWEGNCIHVSIFPFPTYYYLR
jgi:hypothetical protein